VVPVLGDGRVVELERGSFTGSEEVGGGVPVGPHDVAIECKCEARARASIGCDEARFIQSASRQWRHTLRHKPFLRMCRDMRPARLASQAKTRTLKALFEQELCKAGR